MKFILILIFIVLIGLFTFEGVQCGHILFPPVPTKPPSTPRPTHTPTTTDIPEKREKDYGGPINDEKSDLNRPSWVERSTHFLTNILRIDPQGYKQSYLLPSNGDKLQNVLKLNGIYKPTQPLYYRGDLDRSSYQHSKDMASTPCFSHSNCNGTLPDDRLRSFYKGCGGNPDSIYGENIIKGMKNPKEVINYWICEAMPVSNEKCTADGNGDGHRGNLMNPDFYTVGLAAVVSNKDSYMYWTQDFDSEICPRGLIDMPIHSGSHFFSDDKSTCLYGATFYSDKVFSSVEGIIHISSSSGSDSSHDLKLTFGTSSKGVYMFQSSSFNVNDKYYFEFNLMDDSKNSTTYRYPEKGFLILVDDPVSTSKSWSEN